VSAFPIDREKSAAKLNQTLAASPRCESPIKRLHLRVFSRLPRRAAGTPVRFSKLYFKSEQDFLNHFHSCSDT